jgi:hypothetical protein
MKQRYMSSVVRRNVSRNVLHSRLQWLSRLADHRTGTEREILDARCHLIVKTIMRRTIATIASEMR